jgi:hypothetical protein
LRFSHIVIGAPARVDGQTRVERFAGTTVEKRG